MPRTVTERLLWPQIAATPIQDNATPLLFPFPGRVHGGGVLELPPPEAPRDRDPAGHGQDGPDKPPPPYTPKIVCRTHLGDVGIRPLAPGLMFWESPDIWVTAPDGTDVPVAGQPNVVHVHVWNVGTAPSYGTVVELYWCNPTVGVNVAGATLIGAQSTTLQAGEHTVLDFPWTPTFVNGGHECLVAHASDALADPLVAPFNPVLDCHAAQHNINVITVPAGQPFGLQFVAANFSARRAQSRLEVHEVVGADLRGVGLVLGRDTLAPSRGAVADLTGVELTRAVPTLDLKEHPVAATFRETLDALPSGYRAGLVTGALMGVAGRDGGHRPEPPRPADDQLLQRGRALRPGRLDLDPGTQAHVTLTVQAAEQALPGSTFAFRVVETVDGTVTGGITYVVRVGEARRG